jgi:hypothetical protein
LASLFLSIPVYFLGEQKLSTRIRTPMFTPNALVAIYLLANLVIVAVLAFGNFVVGFED